MEWSHGPMKPQAGFQRRLNKTTKRIGYECSICHTVVHTHLDCIFHRASHFSRNTHQCSMCGRGFTEKCNMVRHIRLVHQGERSYPCSLCGRRFSTKQHMQEHMERSCKCKESQPPTSTDGQ